jgi:predicted nucleotidyltransferase
VEERRITLGSADLARMAAAAARACEAEPAVRLAYLHGSVARGDPARDVDVALYLDPALSTADWLKAAGRVGFELQRAASVGLDYDVRPLNGSGPFFRHTVTATGKLLFERDRSERIFTEAMWESEWHDFKPFWERQQAWILARGAR